MGAAEEAKVKAPEEEVKEEEQKEDEKTEEGEEVKKEDVKEEVKAEAPETDQVEEDKPPKVDLTDEEKKTWFKPQTFPDLMPQVMNASFSQFTIPEDGEDFEKFEFEWRDEATSRSYLRRWVLEKKRTTRLEDVQPSEWFFTKLAEWQKALQEWQLKQKEFQQDPQRREAVQQRALKERDR